MAKKHLHDKLGITFVELLTLLGVRDALVRGLLVYKRGVHESAVAYAAGQSHVFNMQFCGRLNTECGSVGCIGGYMALAMAENMHDYVNVKRSKALVLLFFPPVSVDFGRVTTDQAVTAIDRFLVGKKPWVIKDLPRDRS